MTLGCLGLVSDIH